LLAVFNNQPASLLKRIDLLEGLLKAFSGVISDPGKDISFLR
jgi:hypothetical protein